jgi:hypothetical protein
MEEQGSGLPLGGSLRRKAERQAEERRRGLGRLREAFRRRDADEEASKRRWRIDVARKRTGE